MGKLGEFIKATAVKAGVDLNAENNKTFVDALATLEAEIPDHVTELINRGLISIKEAKNNHGELKNHYASQALDALDREIEATATELGLPDADKDELKLERSSYKRATLLAKKAALQEKLKAAEGKPDQKKINDQIAALNGEIAAEKTKNAQLIADFAAKEKKMKMSYAVDGMISQYKTILDTLPGQARNVSIRNLLDEELSNNAAKLDIDNTGSLALQTLEGASYFDPATNTPLNAKQFVERLLAKSKLLVVNDNKQNPDNTDNTDRRDQNNQNRDNQNGQKQNAGNSLLREINEKAKLEFKNASTNGPLV